MIREATCQHHKLQIISNTSIQTLFYSIMTSIVSLTCCLTGPESWASCSLWSPWPGVSMIMSLSVLRKMATLLTPCSVTDITSAETGRWDYGANNSTCLTCLHQVSEHFCPDGLVFDETSTSYAKCGFPFSIDCTGGVNDHVKFLMQHLDFTGREDLQPPQPSPGCPRQEGYFSYPDEKVREEIISDF